MKIKIHQFSPSAIVGDGITNGMIYLQRILQEFCLESYIYAENFDLALNDKIRHYSQISEKDTSQILLIHYSIYYDFDVWINKLLCRKIMIYHNITPYTFFQKGSHLYHLCKEGKEYLPSLASKVIGAIGDSVLNTEELVENGFNNVETIPLLLDLQKIEQCDWNRELFDNNIKTFNIIFVGRIARNKAQHDLIEIASVLKSIDNDFKMYLIGGTTDLAYEEELKTLISKLGLENHVELTGKVSDCDLYAYYRSANIFLSMSEHEGFGIPLVEAMFFRIPIIAFNSSNIKNTLNGGGVLFNKKEKEHIAGLICLMKRNKALKREILSIQDKALTIYEHDVIVQKLAGFLDSLDICKIQTKNKNSKKMVKYQFEGPFDSSYSLAILNQNSAKIFSKHHLGEVSLYPIDGYFEYTPNQEYLKMQPTIMQMAQLSYKAQYCEVVFRNLYPPNVFGMKGKINLLNSYGWEESAFPREYIENFNLYLDGMTVMSQYVKKVMLANGIKVPVEVVGLGVEHILDYESSKIDIKTNKKFKFLHISSCFPRKGIDILLEAYSRAFKKSDDVCLIIKTFPNPHNNIIEKLAKIKQVNPDLAEIILINEDLEQGEIRWLYENSDVLVAPSKGEGFGLPIAEAMLLKLPVIATGFGGHMDFCNEQNSYLIDYTFESSNTHLNLFNSYWVQPSQDHLAELLLKAFSDKEEQKEYKIENALKTIAKFSWQNYYEKTEKFIRKIENEHILNTDKKNIGWISSFNTKCGIATYSQFILNHIDTSKYNILRFANQSDVVLNEDFEKDIIRCWNNRFDINNDVLVEQIVSNKCESIVLNFNFGFFGIENLKDIIEKVSDKGIKIIIIFHSVADVTIPGLEASLSSIISSLLKVNYLLVHNIEDMNFFKNLGLKNMELLSHGVTMRNFAMSKKTQSEKAFTIASYGFLLPHKGILELIEAFALLCNQHAEIRLLLVNAIYPAKESLAYYNLCLEKIKTLKLTSKIEFITDFLDDDISFEHLDKADILVMPYRNTNESASGAIRYAVSTLKPILCTKQHIFEDVSEIVHFMDGYTPQEMSQSIEKFINNASLLSQKIDIQKRWIQEHDWKHISRKIENFIE